MLIPWTCPADLLRSYGDNFWVLFVVLFAGIGVFLLGRRRFRTYRRIKDGPPDLARTDLRKRGKRCQVPFSQLEPHRGDLTKPRPTAWVNGTQTHTRALKGRNNPF
jgi:hypothetical protein